MARVLLSLPILVDLANAGGYSGIAALSNESAALILSASFWIGDLSNWVGDGLELTTEEADRIDGMVAKMEDEIMQAAVGIIVPWPNSNTPTWALPCDGGEYLSEDYPELWRVLIHDFAASENSFYTPDLINRVPVGSGDEYAVADEVGAKEITLTEAEMPAHVHDHLRSSGAWTPIGELPPIANRVAPMTHQDTESTGGDEAHSNMQPSLGLNYVIVSGRYTDHG